MDAEKTGAFLAALRKSRGYTQQEVAARLGITDKTVSKWERGGGYPDIVMLPALAELFGVTADELLRGERLPEAERSVRDARNTQEQAMCFLENSLSRARLAFGGALGFAACGFLLYLILSETTFSAPLSCGVSLLLCVPGALLAAWGFLSLIRTARSGALADFDRAALRDKPGRALRLAAAAVFSLVFAAALSFAFLVAGAEYGGNLPLIARGNPLGYLIALVLAFAGARLALIWARRRMGDAFVG